MPFRPLIGLTVGRRPSAAAPGQPGPGRTIDGVDAAYARAVEQAGGRPVLLPIQLPDDPEDLVGRLDGVVLTGGGDVDPGLYGAAAEEPTGGVDRARDDWEMAVLEAAGRLEVAVLGICRGCQLINVALGGTLHQHLPVVTRLDHLEAARRESPVHTVTVTPGSRLEAVVGPGDVEVNSIHHQGLDRLGRSLRPSATAPDGLVEAVEHTERPLLAVQWHPECLVPERAHLALFEWLVAAAGVRR